MLSKVFDGTIAGRKIKHTIEPRLVYRYTNGVENFGSIIRFDFRDILSNTNEVEVGLLQRLFTKRERPECNQETTEHCSRRQRPGYCCGCFLCARGRG